MMQDGQTATNPQTGEKIVLRGGQWVPLGGAPAQAPRGPAPIIMGAPKQPDPLEMRRFDMAQQDQDRQNRIAPLQEEGARLDIERKRRELANTSTGKPLPEGAAKRLEDTIGLYANLKGAAGGFRDDYAGNTITGGLENTIQGLNNSFGTPGQRDWWANFRTLDNQIRNELFGATLTPSEQTAYAQTSINERMDPATIRENLARREKVIRDALKRRTKYLKANGFNSEAVDALTGEFGIDFADEAPSNSGADQQLVFNDEAKPVTGYRFTPEQDAEILRAVRSGDEGQVIALMQRFSGNSAPPSQKQRESVRSSIEAAKRGGSVGIDYSGVDRSAQEAADRERYGDNLPKVLEERKPAGIDAAVRGIADTGSFGLADELSAAATTLFSGGTMRENLQKERAIDEADRRVNAAPRTVGQLTGAIVNPLGRNARSVGEVTRAGGAGGALYGFGSGDDIGSRAAGAGAGAAAGATGGYLVGRATNALAAASARRAAEAPAGRNALMEAADRQGVQPMPADVGGPLVRRATSAAAQAPLSASSIVRGGERVVNQSRAARDRVAANTGQVLDRELAGEIGQRGGEKFIAATRQQANRYYDRAEKMAQGAKITPANTLATLDRHIAELAEDPSAVGGSHLTALQKLREAIGDGQLSVSGIRSMRSRLRQQFLDDGLRSSDFQRRVGEVVDSASEDLISNLVEQGMEGAATAFRRADSFYRGRVQAIDDFLQPIIANKSGEGVMKALENASRSNGRRLQGFVASLPAEERSAIQATVISRLGAKNADAEAADFSLDVFLSQWKAMTPRSKAALFPKEARAALDDLATVAEGSKAAGAYANRSNTGGVVGTLATGGIAGNVIWAPVSTSLALAGQYGAGKLLASPGFARWLSRAPKSSNPGAARAWINRIPQIPAVRGEIEQLQQRLLANLSQSPSRVNAGDREQD